MLPTAGGQAQKIHGTERESTHNLIFQYNFLHYISADNLTVEGQLYMEIYSFYFYAQYWLSACITVDISSRMLALISACCFLV
jgi:hypothetical protein